MLSHMQEGDFFRDLIYQMANKTELRRSQGTLYPVSEPWTCEWCAFRGQHYFRTKVGLGCTCKRSVSWVGTLTKVEKISVYYTVNRVLLHTFFVQNIAHMCCSSELVVFITSHRKSYQNNLQWFTTLLLYTSIFGGNAGKHFHIFFCIAPVMRDYILMREYIF